VLLGTVEVRRRKGGAVTRIVGFFDLPEPRPPFQLIERLRREIAQDPVSVAPSRSQVATGYFGAFFALIGGLYLSGIGAYWLARGVASRSWPTAEAMIVRSAVSIHHGKGTSYTADIRYVFEANSREYQSNRIQYGLPSENLTEARNLVAQYPRGAHVTVFYDPAHPSASTLLPGAGINAFVVSAAGILLLAFSFSLASQAASNTWPDGALSSS
jgi:hypothetical protein